MSTKVLERVSISDGRPWQVAEVAQQTVSQENRKAGEGSKGRFRIAAEFAGHILAASAGIAVFKFTGLYDAMDSLTGQIILGSVIVYWHVIMFRLGLYSK
jgi:hypothetical protein